MNVVDFKAKYPDLYKTIHAEGLIEGEAAGLEKGRAETQDQTKKDGAKAERERIQAVAAQSLPGHEKLISELMWDGKTTGEQAAVRILQAEKELRKTVLVQLNNDAPPPVAPAAPPDVEGLTAADPNLPIEDRAQAAWDKNAALRHEFAGDFNAYLAGEKAIAAGLVKIIAKKA